MFGWLIPKKEKASTKTAVPKTSKKVKTPKELATENKEPYFSVIGFDFDPENPVQGAFELEWNEYFVTKLRADGYQGKTEEDVIDNYFTAMCRNIALETYEKEQADPTQRQITRRELGGGRAEYQ